MLQRYRLPITLFLALLGVGVIAYYAICDTECAYLTGDLLGIDLTVIGFLYMGFVCGSALLRQDGLLRSVLAAGIGVEVYLIGFQIQEEIFCPYCLAFAGIVLILFCLHYRLSSFWRDGGLMRWIYCLGEAELPLTKVKRFPLLVAALAGLMFMWLTFSGSATPAFADEGPSLPAIGNGSIEITLFSDYFCPPCQKLEKEALSTLKDILSRSGVIVRFADTPMHKETSLYARYFLYAVRGDRRAAAVWKAREALFEAAAVRHLRTEAELAAFLRERKIRLAPYPVDATFRLLSETIRKHRVRSTPTCVIRYSSSDVRRFVGVPEIRKGLSQVQAAQNGTH